MKKTDVTAVVNGLLDMIQDSVKAGEKVTLTGCAPAPAPRRRGRRSCLLAHWSWAGRWRAASPPARLRGRGAACDPQAGRPRVAGGRTGATAAHLRRAGSPADGWSLEIADSASLRASFGTFEQRVRSARKGRNPATGAEISIPETKARGLQKRCPPGARGALASPARPPCAHACFSAPPGAGFQRGQVVQGPRQGHRQVKPALHGESRSLARCRGRTPPVAPVARAAAGRTRA